MNIIKLILAVLGLVFGVMVVLWVLGFVWSLVWYLMFFGVIAAIGWGGYKLFLKAEARALRSDPHAGLGGMEVNMSWDEYDKKYLHK